MERRAQHVLTVCLLIVLASMTQRPVSTRAAGARTGPPGHCIFDRLALKTPQGHCRPQARTYPAKANTAVKRAIYDSSLTFGVPYSILLRVARCESGLNPYASNGSHFGLYQFAPDTFRRGAQQMRQTTGIEASTYWRPRDSAYVAGYLYVMGEGTSWTCSP